MPTFSELPALGSEGYIHTHVREDQIALYGFHVWRTSIFQKLLTVSMTQTAITILSGMPADEMVGSFGERYRAPDAHSRHRRKTAERMPELRDKLVPPRPAGNCSFFDESGGRGTSCRPCSTLGIPRGGGKDLSYSAEEARPLPSTSCFAKRWGAYRNRQAACARRTAEIPSPLQISAISFTFCQACADSSFARSFTAPFRQESSACR